MNDLIAQAEALEAQAKELRRQAAERPREWWAVIANNGLLFCLRATKHEAEEACGIGSRIAHIREVKPVRVTEAMRDAAREAACHVPPGHGTDAVIYYTIREICGLEVES